MAPNKSLKKWIEKAGIANAEAARRLGYDRSNFHRILAGTAKPTMEMAKAIEDLTDGTVPLTAWIGFAPSTPKKRAA